MIKLTTLPMKVTGIDFWFNRYLRKEYKTLTILPSPGIIWDSQYDYVEEMKGLRVLTFYIDWIFWGVGIEIEIRLKNK